MAEMRNYRAEIIAAFKAGNLDTLFELALDRDHRAAMADELENREVERKAARAKQRREERARGSRDGPPQDATSRDVARHDATGDHVARQEATSGDTPSFSPTPPFTPSEKQSTSLPRARELGDRLPTDNDREALWQFLDTVPNPGTWIAELHAMLDGMPGHQAEPPDRIGQAVRDYVLNNACPKANANQFRAYCRKLAQPAEQTNGNGKGDVVRRVPGGVAARSFANGRRALEDLP